MPQLDVVSDMMSYNMMKLCCKIGRNYWLFVWEFLFA